MYKFFKDWIIGMLVALVICLKLPEAWAAVPPARGLVLFYAGSAALGSLLWFCEKRGAVIYSRREKLKSLKRTRLGR